MTLDFKARTAALNPQHSFIVQAPAGSGKTELLTQRYLSLLSQACEAPEEIIAITFTRKAAAEMRERIMGALTRAQDPQPPAAEHQQIAWRLGREALAKNHQYRWNLLENPQRLRILTIDSLCAQFSQRLPLLAGYGALGRIVEDATPYYQQAVHELLIHAPSVELLAHLDNNTQKFSQLAIELLAKREQWLPYVTHTGSSAQLRKRIEHGLSQLIRDILEAAQSALTTDLQSTLLASLSFAAERLSSSPWHGRQTFPAPIPAELATWQSLAQALLTVKGEWRKTVDIRNGFPPKTPEKTAFEKLLATLAGEDTLRMHLQQIRQCPPNHYHDSQWQIIQALTKMLPLLVAQLQLIFQQQGVMDFVELNLAASQALGEEQQPTDLALALDYRIRHLLIDEFQDTSVAQFKLIEKLLQGWEPDDGRSIFLVGDPMQSIYRFRNAEVSLFLRTAQQGIQQIRLTSLQLALNFRSGEQLIAWFNQVFPHVLPRQANPTIGAIPYTAVAATQAQQFLPAVCTYPCVDTTDEAQQLVNIIHQCRAQNPQGKIAILVRSRNHLVSIIPALQKAGILFQAVEIESLAIRSEIQDLVALTRALCHRADRIAWLAILRAPWCGLTLPDLHVIAQATGRKNIIETLAHFHTLPGLSEDGQRRLRRVAPVLSQALLNHGRFTIAEWVEHTWLALGGPAGLDHPRELQHAEAYFQLLRDLTGNAAIFSIDALTRRLEKWYAPADPHADTYLQIMTVHKAKGLEFDHVIIPELHRHPAHERNRLLLWAERADAHGGNHLILAPIQEAGADGDAMYAYLKQAEQEKLIYEAQRLLYVGATRAKQTLHLLAVLPAVPDILSWQPPHGSFLQMLWPYFRKQTELAETVKSSSEHHTLQRLTADWQLPESLQLSNPAFTATSVMLSWETALAEKTAAQIGIVIHEALAALAEQAPHFSKADIEIHWQRRFLHLGLPAQWLATALAATHHAIDNTLTDPRGQWILAHTHQERRNEYALSAVVEGQVIHVILDRTFIDADGVRWIIDYKTGEADAQPTAAYHAQLNTYAQVMSLKDPRPIRLGLYFPLTGRWEEVPQSLVIA